MTDREPGSRTIDWLLQNGANSCWAYALEVQGALDDLRAAEAAEDEPLMAEVGIMMLRSVYKCQLIYRKNAVDTQEIELDASIAFSDDPVAEAVRKLESMDPSEVGVGREIGRVAMSFAGGLRDMLPFEMPLIRARGSAAETMRLAADLSRLRTSRGMSPLNWTRRS
ncbi:hypothetical protein [Nocardia abscessus]|uniref:hypothetical protein n=1 Tax=Nocardia abscessus TaxID=120957 RepID=UPI002453C612|nr:hypothetical protein [Nocardia abscessus]